MQPALGLPGGAALLIERGVIRSRPHAARFGRAVRAPGARGGRGLADPSDSSGAPGKRPRSELLSEVEACRAEGRGRCKRCAARCHSPTVRPHQTDRCTARRLPRGDMLVAASPGAELAAVSRIESALRSVVSVRTQLGTSSRSVASARPVTRQADRHSAGGTLRHSPKRSAVPGDVATERHVLGPQTAFLLRSRRWATSHGARVVTEHLRAEGESKRVVLWAWQAPQRPSYCSRARRAHFPIIFYRRDNATRSALC